MYNWSTDTTELRKDKEKYTIWKLEQMINYGLNGDKIPEKELRKYWDKLFLDPHCKRYLELLLWPKRFSLKSNNKS